MRVAIYARVSTEQQAKEDKVSLEVQEKEIREYCSEHGHEVVEIYVDVQSGADSKQERREFERMLADASKGKFNLIVAWKPDRLFRSMWPAARLKRVTDLHNIAVECVRQPLDKRTLSIWAALAEMEVENFRERSMMGRRRNAEKGKLKAPPWTKYGYDYDPKTQRFGTNDAEAEVVRRIFDWYISGVGARKIAVRLNADGVLTKLQSLGKRLEQSRGAEKQPSKLELAGQKCRGWQVATILKIIDSPEYYGEGYACRYFNGLDNRKSKRAKEQWIPVSYPAIINRALYDMAQEQKKRNVRMKGPKKPGPQFLLDGLLYCKECGYPFNTHASYQTRKLSDGTTAHYFGKPLKRTYICGGMKRYPHLHQCRSNPKMIWAPYVENEVWKTIVECMHNPQFIRAGSDCIKGMASGNVSAIASELEKMNKKFEANRLEEQAILTQFRKGRIDEAALDVQLRAIHEERGLWEQEIERYRGMLLRSVTDATVNQRIEELRKSIDQVTDRPLIDRRELLRSLIDKVWLDATGNITIEVALKELQPSVSVGVPESIPSSWY